MNKRDLINAMADDADIGPEVAKKVLESILGTIRSELARNNRVILKGFGTWNVFIKEARLVRHPSTGKIIKVSTKNYVKFKASGRLTYLLNQG